MEAYRKIREAYIELIRQIEPNFTIKLGGGLGVSPLTFENGAREFLNRLQRKTRGRSWYYEPIEQWPVAVGFLENLTTQRHMHLALRLPIDLRDAAFNGGPIWRDLRTAGDYYAEVLGDADDYARYITKEFHLIETREQPFIYNKETWDRADRYSVK